MDFYQIISLIPNSITFIFDRHRQYKVSGQKKRQSHYFNDHKYLENLWKYVIIGRKISGNLVLLIWEWDKGIFVKIRFRDCCVDVSSGRVGPPWPWCQILGPRFASLARRPQGVTDQGKLRVLLNSGLYNIFNRNKFYLLVFKSRHGPQWFERVNHFTSPFSV